MNGFPTLSRVWSFFCVTALTVSLLSPVFARGPLPGVDADSKFIIYYGDDYYVEDAADPQNKRVNEQLINDLRRFDVVVLQPNQPNFTPEIVDLLKETRNEAGIPEPGVDYVFGYISIGEDFLARDVAPWTSDIATDNTGPRVLVDGQLVPSNPNGGGIASFYIDVETQAWETCGGGEYLSVTRDCAVRNCANPSQPLAQCNPVPDGVADLNTNFLGYMIYPDSLWLRMVKEMRIGEDTPFADRDTKAGLLQITGTRPTDAVGLRDRSKNFGMDGFFFDTLDTAGPYNDINWYPWTLAAMQTLVKDIAEDADFADKYIFANRGGFFFQAGLQSQVTGDYPIDYSIAPYVNAFLFESYLYDSAPGSNEGTLGESEFYTDNRLVQLPKILAEAARPEGFTVFTLEYDSGRSAGRAEALLNNVIDNTRKAFGATAYLADNGDLNTVNLQLADSDDLLGADNDTSPPVWNSTARLYLTGNAGVDNAVRVGAQSALTGPVAGSAVIAWDVAQDVSLPIRYVLYTGTNDDISQANRRELNAGDIQRGDGYNQDPRNAYPYQTTVTDLGDGTWYFWIRAMDAGNREDANTVSQRLVIGAVPSHPTQRIVLDGDLTEWAGFGGFIGDSADIDNAVAGAQIDVLDLRFAHNADTLFVAYELESFTTFNSWGFNLYLDTDNNRATGFTNFETFAIGADYLVQSGSLYRFENNGWVNTGAAVQSAADPHVEIAIPLSEIGNPRDLRAIFVGNSIAPPDQVVAVDYVPDGAASGSADGFQRYSLAAVSNAVENGAITVGDGSAADFAPLTAFPTDADDISLPAGTVENIDWQSVTMAHDDNNLYFLYQAYGLITVDYFLQVFIDSDGDRSTGYSGISDEFPLGAEYMIEGQWLYRFDSDDQSQWGGAWTWLGTVGYSWFSNYGEIFIPRPWMNNPNRLQLFFKGRNNDGNGAVIEDLYPDGALSPEAERFDYVLD